MLKIVAGVIISLVFLFGASVVIARLVKMMTLLRSTILPVKLSSHPYAKDMLLS